MRYLITALFLCLLATSAEAQVYTDPGDSADVGAASRYRLDPTVVSGDSNTAVVGRRYYYPYYDYYGYGYQRGVMAVPNADDPNYFPPEAALLGTQPPAPVKKAPAKNY